MTCGSTFGCISCMRRHPIPAQRSSPFGPVTPARPAIAGARTMTTDPAAAGGGGGMSREDVQQLLDEGRRAGGGAPAAPVADVNATRPQTLAAPDSWQVGTRATRRCEMQMVTRI